MKSYKLKINNNNYEVVIKNADSKMADVEVNGKEYKVNIEEMKTLRDPAFDKARETQAAIPTASKGRASAPTMKKVATGGVTAPIPGLIKGIFVKVGDKVTVGQKLLIMEAMKMENIIDSQMDGVITEILVGDGDNVDQDQELVRIGE